MTTILTPTGDLGRAVRCSRRSFLEGVAGGGVLAGLGSLGFRPSARANGTGPAELRGTDFDLTIGAHPVNFTGKPGIATVVNGALPAPILRWREGDTVTLRVRNELAQDTSIHWHGIILPANMDGVPGLSFHGIPPGGSYTYRFQVRQSGTYWYHSHSGFQEQTGLYGPCAYSAKPRSSCGRHSGYPHRYPGSCAESALFRGAPAAHLG